MQDPGKGVRMTKHGASDGDREGGTEGGNVKSEVTPYLQCHAVHVQCKASPLSTDAESSPSFTGFMHLAVLLLGVSTLRAVLENYRKYGLLVTLPFSTTSTAEYGCLVIVWLIFGLHVGFAFLYERCQKQSPVVPKWLKGISSLWLALPWLNIFAVLGIAIGIVSTLIPDIGHGIFVLFQAVILCLKLASYHLVNRDFRGVLVAPSVRLSKAEAEVKALVASQYPANITLSNLLYFCMAPTLCYQPAYPRSSSISAVFLMKRSLELLICISVWHVVLEQYATPTVRNSMKPFDEFDVLALGERLLKLSLSSLYLWLLLFYGYFHLFLNICAEVLRFGDRRFYAPWWNASSIEEYWRLWNLPAYNWIKRHLYHPLTKSYGLSSTLTFCLIFFVSAILHEIIIGVPARVHNLFAFFGMMLQIPAILLSKVLVAAQSPLKRRRPVDDRPSSSFGNYLFWCVFCIFGQPMFVLLYYRAWSTQSSLLSLFT